MEMKEVIARINELAHKAKAEGLTPAELAERDKLRRIYIDSVKANLVGQLIDAGNDFFHFHSLILTHIDESPG